MSLARALRFGDVMSDPPAEKSAVILLIEVGDLDGVRAAIVGSGDTDAQRKAVNAEDKGTWCSPLHWAATFGHTDIAKLLIDLGADPNAEDIKGSTCLHYACNAYNGDTSGALHFEDSIVQLVDLGAFALEDVSGKLPDAGDDASGFVVKALEKAFNDDKAKDLRASQKSDRKKKCKAKMEAIFSGKIQAHVNNASAVAITVIDSGASDGYKMGSRG